MDKQVVTEMVYDIILSKIVGMIEEMSTNEFMDEVVDRLVEGGVPVDTDNEEQMEDIKGIVFDKFVPLLKKFSNDFIDNQ